MWAPSPDQMLFIILSCVLVGGLEGLRGRAAEFWGSPYPSAVSGVLRAEWPGVVLWDGRPWLPTQWSGARAPPSSGSSGPGGQGARCPCFAACPLPPTSALPPSSFPLPLPTILPSDSPEVSLFSPETCPDVMGP